MCQDANTPYHPYSQEDFAVPEFQKTKHCKLGIQKMGMLMMCADYVTVFCFRGFFCTPEPPSNMWVGSNKPDIFGLFPICYCVCWLYKPFTTFYEGIFGKIKKVQFFTLIWLVKIVVPWRLLWQILFSEIALAMKVSSSESSSCGLGKNLEQFCPFFAVFSFLKKSFHFFQTLLS